MSPGAIADAHLTAPQGRRTSSEVRAEQAADAMSSLARVSGAHS